MLLYNVIEAQTIEVAALLRVGFKHLDISNQLNVSRMIVYRVASYVWRIQSPSGIVVG